MIERRIKELSFALEALSRIGSSYTSIDMFDNVSVLLKKAVEEAQTIYNGSPQQKPVPIDDEIPF
jgi:hypothetical protein